MPSIQTLQNNLGDRQTELRASRKNYLTCFAAAAGSIAMAVFFGERPALEIVEYAFGAGTTIAGSINLAIAGAIKYEVHQGEESIRKAWEGAPDSGQSEQFSE